MNILLDTTYLMPAIGIAVKGVRHDALKTLQEKGHTTSISELTLFELSAKGAKHIALGQLSQERVLRGIQAAARDESLNKVLYYGHEQLVVSFRLRKLVADYLDCAILSSALCGCDALMTEDGIIRALATKEEYRGIIDEMNPEFKLLSHRDLE